MSGFPVTGVAMRTAVGPDARTSAAAFRAGISRARELDHFIALDEEQTDVGPLVGHVADPQAIYAEGLGKMVSLGAQALRSLLTSRPADGRRTGFYLALPNYSLREQVFIGASALTGTGASRSNDSTDEEGGLPRSVTFVRQCHAVLLNRLLRVAGVSFAPSVVGLHFGDNCAFLRALDEAMVALGSGKVDRCIVGGVDSYVDPPSLEWGMLKRRFKCETNPVGFAPGEAAVFMELTAQPAPGVPVAGLVSKPGFGDEPGDGPQASDSQSRGVGLALAIRQAMMNAQRGAGLVIADLNGEVSRAMDWGYTMVRFASDYPTLRIAPVWTPAESFGETGCASPGLAIGVALEAFARRYAKTTSILVLASSNTVERGAAIVSASP